MRVQRLREVTRSIQSQQTNPSLPGFGGDMGIAVPRGTFPWTQAQTEREGAVSASSEHSWRISSIHDLLLVFSILSHPFGQTAGHWAAWVHSAALGNIKLTCLKLHSLKARLHSTATWRISYMSSSFSAILFHLLPYLNNFFSTHSVCIFLSFHFHLFLIFYFPIKLSNLMTLIPSLLFRTWMWKLQKEAPI